jgi:hypothetical protein
VLHPARARLLGSRPLRLERPSPASDSQDPPAHRASR